MKNAGLAGAIALCGIGLIMIGLGGHGEYLTAGTVATTTNTGAMEQQASLSACSEDEPIALFDQVGEVLCLGTPQDSKPYWFKVPFGFSPEQQFAATDLDGDGRQDRLIFNAMLQTEPWEMNFDQPSSLRYEYIPSAGTWLFRNEGPSGDPVLSYQTIRPTEQGWSLVNTPVLFDFDLVVPDNISGSWTMYPSLYDVDGDSRSDLVLVWFMNTQCNPGANCVAEATWHRNVSAGTPLGGDVNNDGQVNGADLTIVLSDWTG